MEEHVHIWTVISEKEIEGRGIIGLKVIVVEEECSCGEKRTRSLSR
jgi:hypothetical protein